MRIGASRSAPSTLPRVPVPDSTPSIDTANAAKIDGSNAVYKLAVPVVARISRSGASLEQAKTSIVVAKWLESADFPLSAQ